MFLAVLLTLLGGWPVVHAKNLLERLHTFDVLHYDLAVSQEASGLRIHGEIQLMSFAGGPFASSSRRRYPVCVSEFRGVPFRFGWGPATWPRSRN